MDQNTAINFEQMKNPDDFSDIMKEGQVFYPVSEDLTPLNRPLTLYGKTIPNRFSVQPMEGFDAKENGAPSDLTFRRYKRFAEGGSGLIWFESVAVAPDGKSNPRMLVISEETVDEFTRLVKETKEAARNLYGFTPYTVLQLNHSGRMSGRFIDGKWEKTPIISFFNPYIDKPSRFTEIVTDQRIEEIIGQFIRGAELAAQAGFDCVDIKACHAYFLRDLLSSFTRPGPYGGSFENRTRALFTITDSLRGRVNIDLSCRLNAYDTIPYPYGWGITGDAEHMEPDLTEPIRLCQMLTQRNVRLFDISASNIEIRPYSLPTDMYTPYAGICDLLKATRDIKAQVPDGVFISTGLSLLKQFGVHVAAGGIRDNWFDFAGFARQLLAYPDLPADIFKGTGIKQNKCCTLCNACFKMMDYQSNVGCIVRDRDIYLPIYREYVEKKKS